MMARTFWIYHAQRFGIAASAAFVSYKTVVAAVSSRIPGQPFYAFTALDWIEWVFSPGEALLILGATAGEYVLLSFALSKLLKTKRAVVGWGIALGLYIGVLAYPLDLLTKIDNWMPLPEKSGALSVLALVCEAVIFAMILPLGIAAAIGRVTNAKNSPKP